MKGVLNLLITGVGGQGNILASRLITNVVMIEGYKVLNAEIYGAAQRGGSVTNHIRISEEGYYGPLTPEGSADIIVGFEPVETLKVLKEFGNSDVKIILDPAPSVVTDLAGRVMDYPDVGEIVDLCEELSDKLKVVRGTELAEGLGTPVVHNIVMVGALVGAGWIPFTRKSFEEAIRKTFPEDKRDINLKALEKGVEAFKN